MVSRLNESMEWAPSVMLGNVSAVVRGTRTFYQTTAKVEAGAPVFTAGGALLGVGVHRVLEGNAGGLVTLSSETVHVISEIAEATGFLAERSNEMGTSLTEGLTLSLSDLKARPPTSPAAASPGAPVAPVAAAKPKPAPAPPADKKPEPVEIGVNASMPLPSARPAGASVSTKPPPIAATIPAPKPAAKPAPAPVPKEKVVAASAPKPKPVSKPAPKPARKSTPVRSSSERPGVPTAPAVVESAEVIVEGEEKKKKGLFKNWKLRAPGEKPEEKKVEVESSTLEPEPKPEA